MTCDKCGSQTPNRLCSDCETIERLENGNDGIGDYDDGRDYVDTRNCRAIIPSSGEQCTNSKRDSGLCGNHEKANNVTRIDDVPGAPFADLRDALVDADVNGVHAYRLATRFKTAPDLWNAIAGLETFDVGEKTYTPDSLASLAADVATLDDVDAGNHPLAEDSCIALTRSDKFDGRCVNGGYGTGLLCGTHKGANDPDTILDDADFPRVDGHGVDHLVVELRADRAIVVDTEKWAVERVERDDVVDELERHYDFSLDDVDEWRVYVDHSPPTATDDQGVEQGAETAVASDGGERLVRCVDCGNEWQSEAETPRCSDPNDECDRSRNVEPVAALKIERDDDVDAENPDGWIDPFESENRRETLEESGLSGREAEVVAAKDQGLTHAEIADELDLPKSTVDEYSRRARSKFNDARNLIDALGETYA